LVRPVREQLEHDRVIRHLQVKLKRRHDVAINPGEEKAAPVKVSPTLTLYPDLVLTTTDRGRRLAGVVEVETNESVNHLEALAQWAHLGRSRVPFHLYVPAGAVDIARRLCADNQITVSEIWSYHAIGDQLRFTLMQRAQAEPSRPAARRPQPAASRRKTPARPPSGRAARAKPRAAAKPVRSQKRK
jgi:hypothetical protein